MRDLSYNSSWHGFAPPVSSRHTEGGESVGASRENAPTVPGVRVLPSFKSARAPRVKSGSRSTTSSASSCASSPPPFAFCALKGAAKHETSTLITSASMAKPSEHRPTNLLLGIRLRRLHVLTRVLSIAASRRLSSIAKSTRVKYQSEQEVHLLSSSPADCDRMSISTYLLRALETHGRSRTAEQGGRVLFEPQRVHARSHQEPAERQKAPGRVVEPHQSAKSKVQIGCETS